MNEINLIPAGVRHTEERRARCSKWGLVLGASALFAAVPYLLALSSKAKAADLRQELEQLDIDSASVRSQLRSATAQVQETLSELQRSKALRTKRSWSGVFALIASALPEDCWLELVSTEPETPPASAAPPPSANPAEGKITIEAPRVIRLTGLAPNDAQPLVFVGNLRESNAFTRVALQKVTRAGGADRPGNESLYQFEVVCEW